MRAFPLGSDAAQNAPATRLPVRIEVPNAHNLQFFTFWVALGAKYFEQEGLEPEVLYAPRPRSVGERLFRGDADVALLPPPMFLGMMAEKKPVALFASLLANEPINLVLHKDIASARGFSAGSPLRDRLLALSGLKVGLASEVTPRLRALFAFAGLDADKQLRLVTVAGQIRCRLSRAGKSTCSLPTRRISRRCCFSIRRFLSSTIRGERCRFWRTARSMLSATTRALAERNPDMMVAVARAIYRAQQLIHSNPAATVDAIFASGAAAQDRRSVETFVAVYGPAVPATPAISLAGIERAATLYPAHPRAPDFSRVDALDFVAPFDRTAGDSRCALIRRAV